MSDGKRSGLLDSLGRHLGKGVFRGSDLRRAAEAEAGGDYLEAARRYASAGKRASVAQMQLLHSERATSTDGKLDALREAALWADEDSDESRAVRRRIASTMLAFCRTRGVITAGDRAIVSEAAALFVSAGDAAGAGECHALVGEAAAAAEAYQQAGDVERLEELLDSEAAQRRRVVAVSDALEDHRLRLRDGDVGGALSALDQALPASERHERAPIQRLRDDLVARRMDEGVLRLRSEGALVIAARAPLVLGREAGTTLVLRDGGISRRHAQLERADSRWCITDLGSKNGTSLGGVRIAGRVPLPERAEIGIGDQCVLDVRCSDAQLIATIVRGLDRGATLHGASDAPILLAPRRPEGALRVRFEGGRARVTAISPLLLLNGVRVIREVEPLVGDVLECADTKWAVER